MFCGLEARGAGEEASAALISSGSGQRCAVGVQTGQGGGDSAMGPWLDTQNLSSLWDPLSFLLEEGIHALFKRWV
jgi:hypothetical protein